MNHRSRLSNPGKHLHKRTAPPADSVPLHPSTVLYILCLRNKHVTLTTQGGRLHRHHCYTDRHAETGAENPAQDCQQEVAEAGPELALRSTACTLDTKLSGSYPGIDGNVDTFYEFNITYLFETVC